LGNKSKSVIGHRLATPCGTHEVREVPRGAGEDAVWSCVQHTNTEQNRTNHGDCWDSSFTTVCVCVSVCV
jgi:hypothetical protein